MMRSPFSPVHEVIHGIEVSDPYRWLEDPTLPETQSWIGAQQEACSAYFAASSLLPRLRDRVEAHLNVDVVDQPARAGSACFFRRRERDREQAAIYVREEPGAPERLVVRSRDTDPYTSVAIHGISDDGSLLAYSVREGGTDTKEIRFIDVVRGAALASHVPRGHAHGFAFRPDLSGFYVCHEDLRRAEEQSICFHSLRDPSFCRKIFSRPNTDGSRLVLLADEVHLGALWIYGAASSPLCDLHLARYERDWAWRTVFECEKLAFRPLLHRGRIFLFCYDRSLNGRMIEIDSEGNMRRTVIPEDGIAPRRVVATGGRFFVSANRDGRPTIASWTLDGEDRGALDIAFDGTIQLLPQLCQGTSFFYTHQSFTEPTWTYEYSTLTDRSTLFDQRVAPPLSDQVEARELSYPSRDGTAIPISIVGRKSTAGEGPRPLVMTSYGGFGVRSTPQYSVLVKILLDLGVQFALPRIRGGGDFGITWHDAGRRRRRQTGIDDFLAAAEWLCARHLTTPRRIGIFGGSQSGLLVASAMTQKPALFRAVVCIAPLLDMVRYERFARADRWKGEYGTVSDPDDFRALLESSPYHRIHPDANYPATLFVTGDRDERCDPAHVRKMAARLQNRPAQTKPILVDYSAERGHTPVLPLTVRTEALARRLAFLARELEIDLLEEGSGHAVVG